MDIKLCWHRTNKRPSDEILLFYLTNLGKNHFVKHNQVNDSYDVAYSVTITPTNDLLAKFRDGSCFEGNNKALKMTDCSLGYFYPPLKGSNKGRDLKDIELIHGFNWDDYHLPDDVWITMNEFKENFTGPVLRRVFSNVLNFDRLIE